MSNDQASSPKSAPRLSVVVPCYNEALVVDAMVARLTGVCDQAAANDYEIVLVNDGSSDQTWPLICAHAARTSHVVGIDLARNYGHQLALTAGLTLCRGDLILLIDADLQDPPELLPQMMAKIDEGFDVVYGVRLHRRGETLFKRVTAFGYYRLLNK